MGVATGTGTGEPIIRLPAAAKRAVGEAVGAGDNLRTHEALGAGAKQEDTPVVRRTVETAMCNSYSDAYNADWTSTLLIQNEGSGDGPVYL